MYAFLLNIIASGRLVFPGHPGTINGRNVFGLTILILICSIVGCSSPALIADHYARANNYTRLAISGQDFTHVVYLKQQNSIHRWHIYLEGDGLPWISKHLIARDPTPMQSLMLKLMTQDTISNIYLGRPCYHGMVSESNCNPWLWTHGRYSEQVVSSMVSALNKLIHSRHIKQITLIGHSGGGTLAVLMAERIKEVDTIISLAGNLDVRAWTEQHGYSTLKGSLNPAKRPPLPKSISEYHFIGEQDRVIPLPAILQYVNKRPSACLNIIHNCTHLDCWEDYWTPILKSVINGQGCGEINL